MKLAFLTIINSVAVSVTYFESLNNFLWHNNWADQPVTASAESWAPYVLAVGSVMCGLIGISNQIGMPTRIAKFVNQVFAREIFAIKKSNPISKTGQMIVTTGSFCKALISSSSLLSSVRDLTGGLAVPIAFAATCFIGNFVAVMVVLMEHHGMRLNWQKQNAMIFAGVVGVTYGLSQLCIYSNSIFNPLMLTNALSARPGWFNTDTTGRIIYGLTFIPRFEFTMGSGQAIYGITKKVAGSDEAEEPDEKQDDEPNPTPTTYQKWRGGVASAYKSVALLSSIFGFSYFLSNQNPFITAIATLLGLFAVPGVVAVLYPIQEERLSENFAVSFRFSNDDRELGLLNQYYASIN